MVLPDSAEGQALFRRLGPLGPETRTVLYPSGRPWVVGRWDGHELTTASAGQCAIVLIGLSDVTRRGLESAVERLGDIGQLDDFLQDWRGSFHTIASVAGQLRAQGTAYGVRRIYHTTVGGTTIVGDRAATLARLVDAEVDTMSLATRLMMPTPYPLTESPMWTGVHAVRPGRYLTLSHRDGRCRQVRWHWPPGPVVLLETQSYCRTRGQHAEKRRQ